MLFSPVCLGCHGNSKAHKFERCGRLVGISQQLTLAFSRFRLLNCLQSEAGQLKEELEQCSHAAQSLERRLRHGQHAMTSENPPYCQHVTCKLLGLVHSSTTHGLNSSHQRPQIASCFAAKAISCLMSKNMVAELARVPGLPWVHESVLHYAKQHGCRTRLCAWVAMETNRHSICWTA
jgi:hypothetical protein